MLEFFAFCIVGYCLLVLVWSFVEIFLFEIPFKKAVISALFWPVLVWKVKTGRKRIPTSNYSEGATHSDFTHNQPPEVVKDERDASGSSSKEE